MILPFRRLQALFVLALTFLVPGVVAKPIKVGFAQTGAESAWRTANTQSMKSEAEKRGIELKFADGQGKQENQIRAIRSFIAQRVDAIVLAP
ncbi:MAG TPA: LacI family transcriptional regulator, partial [Opitutaceae bacterium]|nr:LacI family transcriptional regulator [Opitutaceae bacterium]